MSYFRLLKNYLFSLCSTIPMDYRGELLSAFIKELSILFVLYHPDGSIGRATFRLLKNYLFSLCSTNPDGYRERELLSHIKKKLKGLQKIAISTLVKKIFTNLFSLVFRRIKCTVLQPFTSGFFKTLLSPSI